MFAYHQKYISFRSICSPGPWTYPKTKSHDDAIFFNWFSVPSVLVGWLVKRGEITGSIVVKLVQSTNLLLDDQRTHMMTMTMRTPNTQWLIETRRVRIKLIRFMELFQFVHLRVRGQAVILGISQFSMRTNAQGSRQHVCGIPHPLMCGEIILFNPGMMGDHLINWGTFITICLHTLGGWEEEEENMTMMRKRCRYFVVCLLPTNGQLLFQ